ncbi:MAG TPA: hypothetical protein VFQ61_12465 [Polyangiaceae bacterium]|nr:hypothetical protein [Polyangiaceae bacterium]
MTRYGTALVLCFGLLGPVAAIGVAHADLLPPDACQNEGETCDNATGGSTSREGVCLTRTCTRVGPPFTNCEGGAAGAAAGGTTATCGPTTTTYDCLRCIASSGGSSSAGAENTAGATHTGGHTATGGTSSAGDSSKDDSSCDCAIGRRTSERGLALAMLAIGAIAWRRARRRLQG